MIQHGNTNGGPAQVALKNKKLKDKRDAARGTPSPPHLTPTEKAALFVLVRKYI